jgi:hypothetical protein
MAVSGAIRAYPVSQAVCLNSLIDRLSKFPAGCRRITVPGYIHPEKFPAPLLQTLLPVNIIITIRGLRMIRLAVVFNSKNVMAGGGIFYREIYPVPEFGIPYLGIRRKALLPQVMQNLIFRLRFRPFLPFRIAPGRRRESSIPGFRKIFAGTGAYF